MTYKSRTFNYVLCGIFAAVTGIAAGISVPLPFTPVPVSLATFGVLLAGSILGAKYGSISMVVYVLLGACGVPIFSEYTGGIGKLIGPTGGYIIGYIFMAMVVGLLIQRYGNGSSLPINILAMVLGTLVCYTLGTAWFIYVTHTNFIAALTMCIFPFLIGDAVKVVVSALLCRKLRPILLQSTPKDM